MIQFTNGRIPALYSGRSNLALTIMTPSDCQNHCKFCTSKKEYALNKPNKDLVLEMVDKFFGDTTRIMVKDVVITGGEPMNDIDFLQEVVKRLPLPINVYINTSLIERNIDEFIDFVNNTPQVKGVNISRHTWSYADDCKILNGIAPDEKIREFKKPVRINCVIGETIDLIDGVIERWKGFENLEISFRADFTKTTNKDLHIPFCKVNTYLANMFEYMGNTQCHVCDTTIFKTKSGMLIKYHRGLQTTSIRAWGGIEVNDFVLRQDGKLFIDWDFSESNEIVIASPYYAVPPFNCGCYNNSDYMPSYSCGGGCGSSPCGGYIRSFGGCGGSGC